MKQKLCVKRSSFFHSEITIFSTGTESPMAVDLSCDHIEGSLIKNGMFSSVLFENLDSGIRLTEGAFKSKLTNFVWSVSLDFSARSLLDLKTGECHVVPLLILLVLCFPGHECWWIKIIALKIRTNICWIDFVTSS